MNKTKLFILGLVSIFMTSVAIAQTIDETHKNLTAQHKAFTAKVNELNSGKAKDYKKYSEEIGVLLASVKKLENDLERKQNPKEKETVKQEQDAIKKHHASAETHYQKLKEEAAKPAPSLNKLKEYSKLMNSQIIEAEKKHGAMKAKGKK